MEGEGEGEGERGENQLTSKHRRKRREKGRGGRSQPPSSLHSLSLTLKILCFRGGWRKTRQQPAVSTRRCPKKIKKQAFAFSSGFFHQRERERETDLGDKSKRTLTESNTKARKKKRKSQRNHLCTRRRIRCRQLFRADTARNSAGGVLGRGGSDKVATVGRQATPRVLKEQDSKGVSSEFGMVSCSICFMFSCSPTHARCQ